MTSTRQHPRRGLLPYSVVLILSVALFVALAASSFAQAQAYSVLWRFTGGRDGWNPSYGSLVQDPAGNLYGIASLGGDRNCNAGYSPPGCGTVFKLTPPFNSPPVILYRFHGGTDGGVPESTLVLSGNWLYGTTLLFGHNGACCGVVFRVDKDTGAYEVIYRFTGTWDGGYPAGGVILVNNLLYGTTSQDGMGPDGTLYSLNPAPGSTLTILHQFNCGDGAYPYSSLTSDPTGSILYGTTPFGGFVPDADCRGLYIGFGVAFSYDFTTSKPYHVLYDFTGLTDGGQPFGSLAIDSASNLYGTASVFGDQYLNSYGVVFELPASAQQTPVSLFNFDVQNGKTPYGAYPFASVIRSASGRLYGTTECGGSGGGDPCPQTPNGGSADHGYGTVFELTPTSVPFAYIPKVLHTFKISDPLDGAYSSSGVIMDPQGNLFGVTGGGGSAACPMGCGVVWEITFP